jgi:hypothetical protein
MNPGRLFLGLCGTLRSLEKYAEKKKAEFSV